MTPEQESWKERLNKLKIPQSVFANMVGVYNGEMCEYLSGKREPRIERFKHIEATLKRLEENA